MYPLVSWEGSPTKVRTKIPTLRKCDSVCHAQRFAVECFAKVYYDIYYGAHDLVICLLAQLTRAFRTMRFSTCMSGIRTCTHIQMPIYGNAWQGRGDSVTHSRTHALSRHFEGDKCLKTIIINRVFNAPQKMWRGAGQKVPRVQLDRVSASLHPSPIPTFDSKFKS